MKTAMPYSFLKTATFDEIKKSLIQNGVAYVTEYLDPEQISRLRNEASVLIGTEHPHRLVDGECRLARFKTNELENFNCDEIMDRGKDEFLINLADNFYKPYTPDFHKVYCHHDVNRMSYNSAWHFDRGLSLKYFFYLNDVTVGNGAFMYDLGSHRSNLVKQHLWWQANMPILNYVPENEVLSPISIEGSAGTLIIFDNSGYHRAGTITNGGERWVVRFHVRAGKHINGNEVEKNPYARRNWEYRSACYSEREDEAKAPWSPIMKKEKISEKKNNDPATNNDSVANQVIGIIKSSIKKFK